MTKLAGTSWGANSKIIRQVDTGAIRPIMEYASNFRATAARSNLRKLNST
jgi:hypothetical protein